MELEHFSHEHPLILEEEHNNNGVEVSCYVCQQPISGPTYSCRQCQHFSLHKVCAELPTKMEHPMHPEHHLILLPDLPYSQSAYECSACQQPYESFTYSCFDCNFQLDILCALLVQKIEHICHKHPLTPLQRPTSLLCDACGTKHEGTFYQCTTCRFWVNQNCALLPSTIKYSEHDHLLFLIYSFPYEHFRFTSYCAICTEKVDRIYWAYYCAQCRYFAHINCLTSKIKLSRELEEESCKTKQIDQKTMFVLEKLEPNLIGLALVDDDDDDVDDNDGRVEKLEPDLKSLPLLDESINLITHFKKKINLEGKSNKPMKIDHVSHYHPLLFVDNHINDESCTASKLLVCAGCTQPITNPFYHCAECNFTMHECCVELPIELQHPIHPNHPLILNRWQSIYSDLPLCQGCKMSCNGVLFGCVACDFFLDMKCASLLGTILHDTHKHFLTLRETTGGLCFACHKIFYGVGLVCDICNFKLHTRCALLPRMVSHRFDKHPFSLLYFGDQDEYYCEICEGEVNPFCWFYHCDDCNRSLHKECIHPVSFLPQCFITHESHQHTLALKETCNVPCEACKHDCYGVGFGCDTCNFTLHTRCASLPQTVKHRYNEHPFILTYFGDQGENYCEICWGKINPKCWFYHCVDYNLFLHTLCIQIDEYRGELNIASHPHNLSCVHQPKDISACDRCGELVEFGSIECAPCNFKLHSDCARNEAMERILSLQLAGKLDPVDSGHTS
ncbi:hypothetical protein ACSBR1_013456 [Camellia fascicularis]